MQHSRIFEKAGAELAKFEPALYQIYAVCDIKTTENTKVPLRIVTREGICPTIEYNPNWVETIEHHSILAFMLAVESLRVMLHHCTSRRLSPISRLKKSSDIICTVAGQVLDISKPEVIEFKRKYVDPLKAENIGISMESEDFFMERVFEILNEQEQENSEEVGGESGQEQGDTSGSGKYFDYSEEAAEIATDGWEENSLIDEKTAEIFERVAKDRRMWGSLPGSLMSKIIAVNTFKVNWKRLMNRFKQTIIQRYSTATYSRQNRRDEDQPGLRHLHKSKVLFAIDVSGSMSEEDIAAGYSLIAPLFKHSEIQHCCWDAKCSDFEKVRRPKREYDTLGGGGTNPQCILNKIAESGEKFDGIILFTDNGFDWERPQRGAHKIAIVESKDACAAPSWVKTHVKLIDILKDAK